MSRSVEMDLMELFTLFLFTLQRVSWILSSDILLVTIHELIYIIKQNFTSNKTRGMSCGRKGFPLFVLSPFLFFF